MATQKALPGSVKYGNVYLNALIDATWSGTALTYSFRNGEVSFEPIAPITATSLTWDAADKPIFSQAFATYSAVCKLTFTAKPDNTTTADLGLWSTDTATIQQHMPWASAIFTLPYHLLPQLIGAFASDQPGYEYKNPGSGTFGLIIHELGHALGLAHPHDSDLALEKAIRSDETFPGVTTDSSLLGENNLNQEIWTVMSYNSGWIEEPNQLEDWQMLGHVKTPMAFDIAALQKLYGANKAYNTGNNTYSIPTANTDAELGWACIWDAGGTDTLSAAPASGACTLNLNAAPLTGAHAGGYVSWMAGVVGGFTIANNVVIENAIGGNGDDSIVGNSAKNNLSGGIGNDSLSGGVGNDTLSGGAHSDRFIFDSALKNNKDTLSDFVSGTDVLALDSAIFQKLSVNTFASDNFYLGAKAHDSNDYIIYNNSSGALYYDADGSGKVAAIQFALLIGKPTLTIEDVLVY